MALAREQITIVDLHDGVDGSTYSLNILGGTRTISYNATGKLPTPTQTAYSCELYKDGVKVTPSSYAWSASGHLSGTSTAAGFTPTAVETYDASLTSSNVVSLTVAYKGMVFKGTVQVVVTKAATDAKLITLVADSQVFKVVGKTVSPTTAKITAETQNTSVTAWTYSSNGAAFTGTLPAGVTRSGSTVTVTGASMTAQTIAVKASDGTYSDVMTIVKVADGGEGKPGAPAVQPVTGFLTNESVTFPADFEGKVTGHTGPVGSFKVFQGTTDVTASATFTASNNVGGTVSISSTGVYTLNSLDADRASVDLKAVYGGVSIVKTLTISKSRAGTPGPVGRAVDKIDVMYYSSTSPTTQENGSWSTNAPAWVNGRFIWSKTVTTYTEGTPPTTSSLPILLTGATGNTGRGIKSITEQYALTGDKDTAPSQGSSLWKDAAPTWTNGSYMWTRSKIVYLNSDGSETTAYVGVSVDTAWEAVNEIEIGGRNLLFGLKSMERTINGVTLTHSNGKITLNGTCTAPFYFAKVLSIDGGIYTLSANNPEIAPNAGTRIDVYGATTGIIVADISKVYAFTTGNLNAGTASLRIRIESGTTYTNFELTPKLEKGNIPTDWTPAPEDIEERLVSHDARIDTTEREIALRATKTEVGSIDTRLKAAELKVTADAITSTVRSSTEYTNDQGKKVSADEIISKINQTAEKITIDASKIDIKGKVTFESFAPSTAAEINSKAKTFTSTPVPPYSLGDIWKNSTSTYMCKVARATGSYVASDWEKTGDVTSANKAADTSKVNGTAAATVVTGATAGSAAKTATDRWTYTGKTTINGGQIEADTVTAAQIKANTITANEIEAKTITVDELASSVGSSLDLSSNTAITSRVTSTELGTALNGKEDSLYKQTSAPAHKVGRLWLNTSVTPNALSRSTGSAWVKVTPTTAAEVGAYSSADGSALVTRVSAAEQKILPGSIKSTVEEQVKNNGSTVLATKSEITQTETDWTAKFSSMSVGPHNIALRSDKFYSNTDYPTTSYNLSEKIIQGEDYIVSFDGHLGVGKTRFALYLNGGAILLSFVDSVGGGKYEATFKGIEDLTTLEDTVYVYPFPSSVTGVVNRVFNFKLAKGNKSTPYSRSPLEIYSGMTRIDSDGINVSLSNSDINTQIAHNGLSVYSENNLLATFGGSGAQVPVLTTDSITGDIVNVLAEDVTLTVGEDREFATITKALQYLGGDGKRTKFLNGKIITINVFGVIEDDVFIRGYQSGEINITFYTRARLNGRIYLEGNTTSITIQGSSTTSRGVISYSGITPTLIDVWACNYVRIQFMEFDRNGNTNVNAVRFNNGSIGLVNDSDFGTCRYGINLYRGSLVNASDNRGSNTSTSFFIEDSTLYQRGTKPTIGINATRGHYVTSGTITDLASAFVAPGKKATTLIEKFYKTSMYTNLRGTNTRANSYGYRAVQGRVSSMSTAMDGYVVFNREAYDFIQGGSGVTVKLWLYRTGDAHGYSAPVTPSPDNFSASFGGAGLGQWVSATISSSYLTSSGATFRFYSPNVNSGYAIFSNAYLEVKRTKTI